MLTDIAKEIRAGNFTASEIYKLMGKTINTETAQTYIRKKVAESYDVFEEEVSTAAIRHGNDMEPEAIRYYEQAFNEKIKKVPFKLAEWCDQAGASPDGLIEGKNKGIEIKSPFMPHNHVKYLQIKSAEDLKSECPEYYYQVQMNIAVFNADSWDFVSFHPSFPGILRMVCIEILPNTSDIALIKARIKEAVKIKNDVLRQINL